MPGKIIKVDGYQTKWGGKTTAKKTTKKKAQRQLNLLRAIEHGWRPSGKPARDARKHSSGTNLLWGKLDSF